MIMPLLASSGGSQDCRPPASRRAPPSTPRSAMGRARRRSWCALVGGAVRADILARHRLAWWLVAAAGIAVTATSWRLPSAGRACDLRRPLLIRSRSSTTGRGHRRLAFSSPALATVSRPVTGVSGPRSAFLGCLPPSRAARWARLSSRSRGAQQISRCRRRQRQECGRRRAPARSLVDGFCDPVLTTSSTRLWGRRSGSRRRARTGRSGAGGGAWRRRGASPDRADATSQALKARLSLEGVIGSIGRHLPASNQDVRSTTSASVRAGKSISSEGSDVPRKQATRKRSRPQGGRSRQSGSQSRPTRQTRTS